MAPEVDPRPRTTACEACGFWPVTIGTDGSWYCEGCEHQYHMSDDDLWWVRYTESADSGAARAVTPEVMPLSERDSQTFLDALANPPEPNEALLRAAREYADLARKECGACNGSGRIAAKPGFQRWCPVCQGRGHIPNTADTAPTGDAQEPAEATEGE